jgi:hypothetical protein
MKWYDYGICIACAWDITSGMFDPNWWKILIGWGMFVFWMWLREKEVKNGTW